MKNSRYPCKILRISYYLDHVDGETWLWRSTDSDIFKFFDWTFSLIVVACCWTESLSSLFAVFAYDCSGNCRSLKFELSHNHEKYILGHIIMKTELPRENGVFFDNIGISSTDDDLRLDKWLHLIVSTGDEDALDSSLVLYGSDWLFGFVTGCFCPGIVTLGVFFTRTLSLGASKRNKIMLNFIFILPVYVIGI